jgi:glycerate-2-kinase
MNYNKLREDLLAIWQAGVDGVRVDRLIRNNVTLLSPTDELNINNRDYSIEIGGECYREQYHLSEIDRIIIVGGGKASGGMAESLTKIFEPISNRIEIFGWVNVPNDCVKSLGKVHLHAARPAGRNEPTEEAVAGTNEIIRILESTTQFDLCICLVSGGGSALLPAPVADISLSDKCELIRFLSGSGATIQELNSVRKIISRIKGGGLKRICYGKRLISLILSDVLGDPLDVIASGLTVDNSGTANDALNTLQKFTKNKPEFLLQNISLKKIFDYVESQAKKESSNYYQSESRFLQSNADKIHDANCSISANLPDKIMDQEGGFVRNIVIGNNALAVEAAGMEAIKRGYKQTMFSAGNSEGEAEDVGRELIQLGLEMSDADSDCLIHGGEPVVTLTSPEKRGIGGRNQQLVLASICELIRLYGDAPIPLAILSGSTDGEDGPTDAAGAWIDTITWEILTKKIKQDSNFNPESFLKRNDAYNFFKELNVLIKTGITGTNVCDLRIVIRIDHEFR